MNSKNSKSSEPHRLLTNLSDNINLERSDKYAALSNISIFYTRKNIKKSYRKIDFKVSGPTWNEEFELPDGLYFVRDIHEYFEYIIKKHETVSDNPPIWIYVNQIENRVAFRIKTVYYLELLRPETMKLFGSTKSKITKNENGEHVPRLEITEVVLFHCNIVSNDSQQDSSVLYTFVSKKSFGQLLHISHTNFTFLKTFNSELSYIEIWFTDRILSRLR